MLVSSVELPMLIGDGVDPQPSTNSTQRMEQWSALKSTHTNQSNTTRREARQETKNYVCTNKIIYACCAFHMGGSLFLLLFDRSKTVRISSSNCGQESWIGQERREKRTGTGTEAKERMIQLRQ